MLFGAVIKIADISAVFADAFAPVGIGHDTAAADAVFRRGLAGFNDPVRAIDRQIEVFDIGYDKFHRFFPFKYLLLQLPA